MSEALPVNMLSLRSKSLCDILKLRELSVSPPATTSRPPLYRFDYGFSRQIDYLRKMPTVAPANLRCRN
jgi:hypothetical protein